MTLTLIYVLVRSGVCSFFLSFQTRGSRLSETARSVLEAMRVEIEAGREKKIKEAARLTKKERVVSGAGERVRSWARGESNYEIRARKELRGRSEKLR